jgi:glutathione S-transferase
LNISVEYRFLDILKGETKTPEFLAIKPPGQILELADGTVLSESNAILCWLTEGTPLMPTDTWSHARAMQWMFFEQSSIDRVIGRARFLCANESFLEIFPSGYMDMLMQSGNEALSVLNNALGDQRFILGECYSAADIALYGYVHCAAGGGYHLSDYQNIERWIDNVRSQDMHIPIDQTPS